MTVNQEYADRWMIHVCIWVINKISLETITTNSIVQKI